MTIGQIGQMLAGLIEILVEAPLHALETHVEAVRESKQMTNLRPQGVEAAFFFGDMDARQVQGGYLLRCLQGQAPRQIDETAPFGLLQASLEHTRGQAHG